MAKREYEGERPVKVDDKPEGLQYAAHQSRGFEENIEDLSKWLADEVLASGDSHIETGRSRKVKTDFENAVRSVRWDDNGYYVTPDGWDQQFALIRRAVSDHEWEEAEVIAKKLEEMLPTPLPQTYPWDWDTVQQFQAGRAQLLFFAGKIEESRDLCLEIVEWMESARNPKDGPIYFWGGRNSIALVDTQNLLSRIYAFEGEFAKSAAALQASQGAYRSGCGNCSEAEEVRASPVQQVLSACSLPDNESVQALARIRSGDIDIVTTVLCESDPKYQVEHAWTEATLALAWYANRIGDQETAVLFLEQVVHSKSSCAAKNIAHVWLENGILRATGGSS
ncbi:MAG: hypothetical protein IH944_03430 [Armatimonadetes bacterium]|nr:hypothetical protein [Armatimonadota bacterium]